MAAHQCLWVSLPNRGLDVLALLLDRAPSLVTKDEILSHVWRDSVVEEGNISFQIALLRKTLDGDGASRIGCGGPLACVGTAHTHPRPTTTLELGL